MFSLVSLSGVFPVWTLTWCIYSIQQNCSSSICRSDICLLNFSQVARGMSGLISTILRINIVFKDKEKCLHQFRFMLQSWAKVWIQNSWWSLYVKKKNYKNPLWFSKMYLTNYRQPELRNTWIFTQLLFASLDEEEMRKREKWSGRNGK